MFENAYPSERGVRVGTGAKLSIISFFNCANVYTLGFSGAQYHFNTLYPSCPMFDNMYDTFSLA